MTDSPTFPAVHLPLLDDVPLPPVMRVALPQPKGEPVADLEGAIARASPPKARLNALPLGSRVAVGVGSRGPIRLPTVVDGVSYLKERA